MKTINIATYADGNYMQHACVMLASLNAVANNNYKYQIYFFYSDCSQAILDRAKQSLNNFSNNLEFQLIKVDTSLRGNLKSNKININDSIYDKMFIYDLLPNSVKRIFFIDADVVLKKDPAMIYDIDLSNKILAAVQVTYMKFPKVLRDALRLEKPEDYFNSGVMIINVEKWHKVDITNKAFKFALENGHLSKTMDQDAINHAVKGDKVSISPLWNPRHENKLTDSSGNKLILGKYQVYKEDLAYFVHFSGKDKPWLFLSNHPRKKDYLNYLKQTSFCDYSYPDFNFKNSVIKFKNLLIDNLIYYKSRKKFR